MHEVYGTRKSRTHGMNKSYDQDERHESYEDRVGRRKSQVQIADPETTDHYPESEASGESTPSKKKRSHHNPLGRLVKRSSRERQPRKQDTEDNTSIEDDETEIRKTNQKQRSILKRRRRSEDQDKEDSNEREPKHKRKQKPRSILKRRSPSENEDTDESRDYESEENEDRKVKKKKSQKELERERKRREAERIKEEKRLEKEEKKRKEKEEKEKKLKEKEAKEMEKVDSQVSIAQQELKKIADCFEQKRLERLKKDPEEYHECLKANRCHVRAQEASFEKSKLKEKESKRKLEEKESKKKLKAEKKKKKDKKKRRDEDRSEDESMD